MSGTYWSDDERPSAPSFIAFSTSSNMRASSAAVARRFSPPTTSWRIDPPPTSVPRLIAGGAFAKRAK